MTDSLAQASWTPADLLIVAAARMLAGASTVLVGIGQPNLAANLARRVHNPRVVLIYESGIIGAQPERLPVSIGDPALVTRAQCVMPMMDLFSFVLQGGHIDVGFLEGVQIDRFGNINTTVIGPYEKPTVRLAGSGGACEIGSLARRTIILAKHERRRFPERVDFITTPGYLTGKPERRRLGLQGGPEALITDLAIMRFDGETGEMYLDAVHPGVAVEQVVEQTGWPLRLASEVGQTPPPTAEELRVLRELRRPQTVRGGGIRLLFVCVGNICRSPMAEGLATGMLPSDATIQSAGVVPDRGGATPAAVTTMQRKFGIDISGHRSQDVADLDLAGFDIVIAMAPEVYNRLRAMPGVAPQRLVQWDIEDPFRRDAAAYEACAEKIEQHVRALIDRFDTRARS